MKPAMNFDDIPHFKPKKQKLLAAILLVIEEAAKASRSLTKGEIVKALFVADDAHLANHGRPITFDNYVAMAKGPVGDLAIDMLNDNVDWAEFGLTEAPWSMRDTRGITRYGFRATPSNRKKLSPTDIDELVDALGRVTTVGFERTSVLTHDHPAWVSAWGGKQDSARAAAMDWRKFPKVEADVVSDLVMGSWNAST